MTILTLIMASLVSWYHRSIIHVLTGCPLHFPDLWLVRCHNSMLWLAGCDTHDVSSTHLHCPWHSFEPQVPNNNERSVWPLYTHGPLITFVHTPVIIKASTGSGTRLFYTPRIYINALYGFTHHNSEYIFIVCCICSAYFHWKSGAMISAMIGSTLHISLSWLPLFLLPPSVSVLCWKLSVLSVSWSLIGQTLTILASDWLMPALVMITQVEHITDCGHWSCLLSAPRICKDWELWSEKIGAIILVVQRDTVIDNLQLHSENNSLLSLHDPEHIHVCHPDWFIELFCQIIDFMLTRMSMHQ